MRSEDIMKGTTERWHSLGVQPACEQSLGAGHAYTATLDIMLLYAFALCCCMLVLCCCMLAYNYVDMMYVCSLFVTHTDIFFPLPSGSVIITRAQQGTSL